MRYKTVDEITPRCMTTTAVMSVNVLKNNCIYAYTIIISMFSCNVFVYSLKLLSNNLFVHFFRDISIEI